jgi:hypothetical protein
MFGSVNMLVCLATRERGQPPCGFVEVSQRQRGPAANASPLVAQTLLAFG